MTANLPENVIALTREDDKKAAPRQPVVAGRFDEVLLGDVTEVLIVGDAAELEAATAMELDLPTLLFPVDARVDALGAALSLPDLRRIYLCFPMDDDGQQRAMAVSEKLGTMRCRLAKLSHGLSSLAEVVEAGLSRRDVEMALKKASPCDPILRAIEQISANDPFVATIVRDRIVPLLVPLDQFLVEDYLAHLRKLVPHTALRSLRKEIQRLQAPPDTDDPPKDAAYQMTPEEEAEAVALLERPDILEQVTKDLTSLGIIGEAANKTALFLIYLSRLTSEPVSATIFGKSADGKSYLVNKVADVVPSEDVLRLSSASARSLEYGSADLHRRLVIVQELEGAEEVLAIIRTAQSEGKLCRMTTLWDSNTGPKTLYQESEVRAVWIITTTQEEFHDENATRVWALTVTASPDQTVQVIEHSKRRQTVAWRRQDAARQAVVKRLQNIQRVLKQNPVEVMIPYANLLTFPATTSRHRRDFERFLAMIRIVAFLKSRQREIFEEDALRYINAEVSDYADAFRIMLPILQGTLNPLSERCQRVLKVCLKLRDDLRADNHADGAEDFTVHDVQRKAAELAVDLANVVDLRKQVRALSGMHEVLECTAGESKRGGVTKRFKIASDDIGLDENGELVGVAGARLGILTPKELEEKIEAEEYAQELAESEQR